MPPISLAPRSARSLSFAEREEIAILKLRAPGCATSPVGSGEPRRLSHVSCSQGGAAVAYRRRRRSGAPDVPSARRSKLAAIDRLRSDVQDHLAGTVMAEDGTPVLAPNGAPGVVDVMAAARTDIGRHRQPAADRPSAPDRVSRR